MTIYTNQIKSIFSKIKTIKTKSKYKIKINKKLHWAAIISKS